MSPVHKTKEGKWQYGTKGKKYSSRAKAVAQGKAIHASQNKKKNSSKKK